MMQTPVFNTINKNSYFVLPLLNQWNKKIIKLSFTGIYDRGSDNLSLRRICKCNKLKFVAFFVSLDFQAITTVWVKEAFTFLLCLWHFVPP